MNRISYQRKNGQFIDYISIAKGITANEGREGNMQTLTIKKHGKRIHHYRGSSLYFSSPFLTDEDESYLKSLAGIKEEV
jgi:hypothetical protein